MSTDALERSTLIDAPVQQVWRAISQPEHLAGWFCDAAVLELRAGARGALTFDRRATHAAMTVPIVVQQVMAPHSLIFRWLQPEGVSAGPGNSLVVTFSLAAQGENRTRLTVTEAGLHEMDWSESEKAAYAEERGSGWEVHLANLAEYVTGQPARSGRPNRIQADVRREEDQ